MNDVAATNLPAGSIRDRMKIVPLGQVTQTLTRFQAVRGLGRLMGMKAQYLEGKAVSAASAVIADPTASDDALRSAFLRVSIALEAEIATRMTLCHEVDALRAEVCALRKSGK